MVDKFTFGEPVRLFPTVKSDEDRATSILLATMDLVPEFRAALLHTVGRRVTKRGDNFFVTVHPKFGGRYSDKDIPDGLIVHTRKDEWKAAIEVKINQSDLDQNQLERYLKRVSEHKCDALITISNEMCAYPERPPLRLLSTDKKLRKIPYYHWSWKFISHTVEKLLLREKFENELGRKVLNEFKIFLNDPKSGVAGFTSMNQGWAEFVNDLKVRGAPSMESYENAVSDWHQETAELEIIISKRLQKTAQIILDKDCRKSAEKRLKTDVSELKKTGHLSARYDIDGIEYPLHIVLEIDQRCLRISMRHDLSEKVKTPYKRIQRFLKNFHDEDNHKSGKHDHVHLFAKWPYVSEMTNTTLFDAIQRMEDGELEGSKLINEEKDSIQYVELTFSPSGIAKDITSRKKIIASIEREVEFFCDRYVNV